MKVTITPDERDMARIAANIKAAEAYTNPQSARMGALVALNVVACSEFYKALRTLKRDVATAIGLDAFNTPLDDFLSAPELLNPRVSEHEALLTLLTQSLGVPPELLKPTA